MPEISESRARGHTVNIADRRAEFVQARNALAAAEVDLVDAVLDFVAAAEGEEEAEKVRARGVSVRETEAILEIAERAREAVETRNYAPVIAAFAGLKPKPKPRPKRGKGK